MVLTGIIQCVNVCDKKYSLRYPKSHTILLACARALANPNIAAIYFSLLVQIQAHRNTSHEHHDLVDLQEVLRQLARDPEVELVRDLGSGSGRLWGCVAKHAADTFKFGEGICLNEDIAQALESTQVCVLAFKSLDLLADSSTDRVLLSTPVVRCSFAFHFVMRRCTCYITTFSPHSVSKGLPLKSPVESRGGLWRSYCSGAK
ncbi:hypothetical protein B0H11DRAFT_2038754 [Mycena galericulata]|nr:hypothetical protein B0H11DRAFT_2038754 [Mycena galericulata]